MTDGTYEKGLDGERRAVEYLQSRGMVLLERRYRSPFGEIDAVLLDGETLVFTEVKARHTEGAGAGVFAVTPAKRRKIVKTAMQFMAEHECDCAVRFDVIELTRDGINLIENAFEGSEY